MAKSTHLLIHLAKNVSYPHGFLACELSWNLSADNFVCEHVHDDVHGSFPTIAIT